MPIQFRQPYLGFASVYCWEFGQVPQNKLSSSSASAQVVEFSKRFTAPCNVEDKIPNKQVALRKDEVSWAARELNLESLCSSIAPVFILQSTGKQTSYLTKLTMRKCPPGASHKSYTASLFKRTIELCSRISNYKEKSLGSHRSTVHPRTVHILLCNPVGPAASEIDSKRIKELLCYYQ